MNKEEALARLSNLENEAAELRKVLEAPEQTRKPSLLPEYKEGDKVYRIEGSYGKFDVDYSPMFIPPDGQNYFSTVYQANSYAEAFSTMLELRRQPGTVMPKDGEYKVLITMNEIGNISIETWTFIQNQINNIGPCFEDEPTALAAINAVGEGKIKAMFETLHHTKVG